MTELTVDSICYDNTRLSDFKSCPRKYFIRHELGWTTDYKTTAAPLVFGSAWHEGMDIIWQYGKQVAKNVLVDLAHDQFMKYWLNADMPGLDRPDAVQRLMPRTPMNAKEMFFHYIDKRWNMIREVDVLAIEQPFAVPIPDMENHWYVGRLDKVVRYGPQKLVLEHKTTTAYAIQGNFRTDYVESWYASSQAKGYQFGAGLYFPGLDGVWIDAALVHAKVHDAFKFIPIAHNIELLREWLVTTKAWASEVSDAKARWAAGESVQSAFKKNEDSCFGKYGSCAFLDICRTCADPTQLDNVPPGFKAEKWEPFSILKLDKLVKESDNE